MLATAHRFDRLVIFTGKGVSWLLLPLIGVILVDAISRKFVRKLSFIVENDLHHFFNSPVFQDAEWHFHSILFLCSLGYAYAYNAHVRLDMFRPRLGARGRIWVELLGGLFLLVPFLCIYSWYAFEFFSDAWIQDEGSGASTGIGNRWFIKFFMLAGPLLLLLSGLSTLIKLVVYLFGPLELRPETRLSSMTDQAHSAFN